MLMRFVRYENQIQNILTVTQQLEMDFERLRTILPKRSHMWSSDDTCKWLQFINLPTLASTFKQLGIDGSCIHLLDDETLRSQLNVGSAIVRKKLINWVGFGLDGYNDYLNHSCVKIGKLEPMPERGLELKKSETTHMRQESKSKLINHQSQSQQCLILEQFEGNSVGFHIIKNEAMSIGFGKGNHIHSLETSISERHAMVGKNKNGFFIQDLGSRHGTYIKINHRTVLKNGMILEIGSYQFMVCEMNHLHQTLKLKQTNTCADIEQENNKNLSNAQDPKGKKNPLPTQETLLVDLKDKQKYSFGRRKENNFQRDDKHMSGMHCKITFFNNNFYIEDYGSTNGTWQRISPEGVPSSECSIQHQSHVKLGTAITYICRINKSETANRQQPANTEMIDENLCRKCCKLENNCLFLPCSHNIWCMECAAKMGDNCPECGHEIGEKIKIHK